MARSSINRDSVEYVKVPVTSPEDITIEDQGVEIAVVALNTQPEEVDWREASWTTNVAKVLIGPGNQDLAPAMYSVWVRITDITEIPVLNAGTITVN